MLRIVQNQHNYRDVKNSILVFSVSFMIKFSYMHSWTPLVMPPLLASQEEWHLIRIRNQFIYFQINIVMWPSQKE